MTCTLLAVARASVTEVQVWGVGRVYARAPGVLGSIGGPMECASLIRPFLFPIIHPNPDHARQELSSQALGSGDTVLEYACHDVAVGGVDLKLKEKSRFNKLIF